MRLKHICATIFAGLVMTHAQGADLISPASQWQYYDKPESPASHWNQANFDHSLWMSGFAEFGYGDGGETTVTSFGDDPTNKPITQYFAKNFTIKDLNSIDALKLRVLADDGAVVYINGSEAFRLNLPINQSHNTLALDSTLESAWVEHAISSALLHQGKNLIAVEVHQLSKQSSDISFDLALTYTPIEGHQTSKNSSDVSVDLQSSVKSEMPEHLGHLQAGKAESVSITQPKSFSNLYRITIGEGVPSLNITMTGGSGDADLYVRYGQAAKLSDWDQRPFKPGNNETVNYQNPQAGVYFVSLFSYKAFADVKLIANWQDPLGAKIVSDGPYVLEDKLGSKQAYWICENAVHQTSVIKSKVNRPKACDLLPEPTLTPAPHLIAKNVYKGVKKIVALSDIHGQFDVLVELLTNHHIINEKGDWSFADGHMVITGDMFDRGEQVNEVLWLLYKLDFQAQQAGGRLHLLMGNHEQMVFMGDLRYVHEKYKVTEELLSRSYNQLYDKNTEIGTWLRSKHTLVKINDALFLHGGISLQWIDRKLTIGQVNQLFRRHIDDEKMKIKNDDTLNFLFYNQGPTWFRGYFTEEFPEKDVDKLLNYFDINHIVVGHTSQEQVMGLFNNKIIAIDSSIKLGESGELLLLEQGKLTRGLFDGSTLRLQVH
ncbi:metallophosphoesterase [Colwellia psychrerythraea]|uniref:Peptidase domain protein n=1 Tax=Colwellia psychrerythraea TaxID=28229 RepID=A0A099KL97_COLPS|nr:metallophosphoesterase [Colwellia psychrerythraea]KGJ91201.1 peptidase domain protein [Colwellia psychrerythraea]